jgi:hypothetical protein
MLRAVASAGGSHKSPNDVSSTLPAAVPSNSEKKDSDAGGDDGAGVDMPAAPDAGLDIVSLLVGGVGDAQVR